MAKLIQWVAVIMLAFASLFAAGCGDGGGCGSDWGCCDGGD